MQTMRKITINTLVLGLALAMSPSTHAQAISNAYNDGTGYSGGFSGVGANSGFYPGTGYGSGYGSGMGQPYYGGGFGYGGSAGYGMGYQEPLSYGLMRLAPGAIGGIAGFLLGGSFGMVGRLVGGFVGFVAGRAIGDILFPPYYNPYGFGSFGMGGAISNMVNPFNQNYNQSMGAGAFPNSTYGQYTGGGGGFVTPFFSGTNPQSQASATNGSAGVVVHSTPQAPGLSDDNLAALRKAFYDAVDSYQETLKSGSDSEKLTAKAAFDNANKAYQEAKAAAR